MNKEQALQGMHAVFPLFKASTEAAGSLLATRGPARDPKWQGRLHHIHDTAVQKQIGRAIRRAQIQRPASCHNVVPNQPRGYRWG